MRVLHVLSRARRRGAETFGSVLHEEFLLRGEASQLAALGPALAGQPDLDVRVLGQSPRHPSALLGLRRAAREVDVVVAHGSSTLLACRLALLGAKTPFVYVNIGDPLHWAGVPSRRIRVQWSLRGAAAIGAISPTAGERVVSHLRVPVEKVHFTGNGRRSDEYFPASTAERSRARVRFGLNAEAPTAVVVAALNREKRLEVAAQTLAQLPDWQLLVVGGGPLESELRREASRLAPGRVTFAGALSDVRDAYRAGDVALLTSETEGLPGVLVEAALAGLPIVATDVGFVSDIVRDGVTGRLVAVADPKGTAAALLDCFTHAHTWGKQGRVEAMDGYELSHVVDRWLLLLNAVRRTNDHAAQPDC